jgi:hypothetical protein
VTVAVAMLVTYKSPGPLGAVREALVTQELEPVGYLRVFRRHNGQMLHVARWDVLSVDGAAQ